MIIWVTGQPGSGKTSLGKALAEKLAAPQIDGQAIWKMFHVENNTFLRRVMNVAEAQALALMYHEKGRNAVVSMVSPYRNQREEFKARMGKDILEVHVHADSDPERPRQEHRFPGYEPPLENALILDTTKHSVEECVRLVLERAGLT